MKDIFLIGDSIRLGAHGSSGYGVYVKEKLQGKANIYAPEENCRFAQYTLRYLHEWASEIERYNSKAHEVMNELGAEGSRILADKVIEECFKEVKN